MKFTQSGVGLSVALALALPANDARAHWCDDMWHSAYNLTVRPDSDTSPRELYVQNNMGYQLPDFKLTATSSSGGAVTLTPPTTLKVANTLLPGEKGIWKITAGSPAKIEDLTFSVAFGIDFPGWTTQDACYPLAGAKPVMVVKKDGNLYPPTPTGLANPTAPGSPCVAIVALGRSLQYQASADFEDVNAGLDNLLQYYCAGRASWGIDDATTKTYCKDKVSTTCPPSKATGAGRVSDYVHLWAAGEMAIRKSAMGSRLSVLRDRLKCAANDADVGFGGYALFVLGYLGEDATAKTFLTTQAGAAGDMGTIAKAALYLMGDTAQKADVQAGTKSSSVFAKVACAAALGIVDKDDAAVTSVILPEVKWTEPTATNEDGKAMYAAHVLEIVAFDRRGWVTKGVGDGPVTFYGETGGGTGGAPGTGGATGNGGSSGSGGTSGKRDGGADAPSGTGGATPSGGQSGGPGSGGAGAGTGGSSSVGGSRGTGGAVGSGGQGSGGAQPGSGGNVGTSGTSGNSGVGGTPGSGGATTANGGNAGGTGSGQSGCNCTLGGSGRVPTYAWLTLAALALLLRRRAR